MMFRELKWKIYMFKLIRVTEMVIKKKKHNLVLIQKPFFIIHNIFFNYLFLLNMYRLICLSNTVE